ncbi:MAG: type II CAAX endopeptidase family protein [Pseudomonadota bacterium]|nr:type II CAAX endopeptidase family protein [Pseudomonadota bacterium]
MKESSFRVLKRKESKLMFLSLLMGYLLGTFAITQEVVIGILAVTLGLNMVQLLESDRKLNHWIMGGSIVISGAVLTYRLPILPSIYNFYGLKTSINASAFNIISNVNKVFIALSFLPVLSVLRHKKPLTTLPFSSLLYLTCLYVVVTCGILIGAALLVKYVKFDFTFPSFLWIWVINMLLVCFGEEVFFRGVVQNYVMLLMPKNTNLAVLLTSVFFGLTHYPAGISMVVLAGIAGLFYGFLYKGTHRLWCPIMLHFSLNFVHFIFFSYPRVI